MSPTRRPIDFGDTDYVAEQAALASGIFLDVGTATRPARPQDLEGNGDLYIALNIDQRQHELFVNDHASVGRLGLLVDVDSMDSLGAVLPVDSVKEALFANVFGEPDDARNQRHTVLNPTGYDYEGWTDFEKKIQTVRVVGGFMRERAQLTIVETISPYLARSSDVIDEVNNAGFDDVELTQEATEITSAIGRLGLDYGRQLSRYSYMITAKRV